MLKKHVSFLFVLALFLSFSACQSDLADIEADSGSTPTLQEYKTPPTGQVPTQPSEDPRYEDCWQSSLMVDKDCNGSYELGWNECSRFESQCPGQLQSMINHANANGWCYQVPSNQCQWSPNW